MFALRQKRWPLRNVCPLCPNTDCLYMYIVSRDALQQHAATTTASSTARYYGQLLNLRGCVQSCYSVVNHNGVFRRIAIAGQTAPRSSGSRADASSATVADFFTKRAVINFLQNTLNIIYTHIIHKSSWDKNKAILFIVCPMQCVALDIYKICLSVRNIYRPR